MEMYTGTVVGGLLSSGLPLIGWIIAVVLGVCLSNNQP